MTESQEKLYLLHIDLSQSKTQQYQSEFILVCNFAVEKKETLFKLRDLHPKTAKNFSRLSRQVNDRNFSHSGMSQQVKCPDKPSNLVFYLKKSFSSNNSDMLDII